jgi:hypothetical protein
MEQLALVEQQAIEWREVPEPRIESAGEVKLVAEREPA